MATWETIRVCVEGQVQCLTSCQKPHQQQVHQVPRLSGCSSFSLFLAGSHSELLAQQGMYARLWAKQATLDDLSVAEDAGGEEEIGESDMESKLLNATKTVSPS